MSGSTILRLAARGDGVTADGRYIALAAPGDLVAADNSITPGPHHIAPACRHFPECGGCQLQHVDDAALAPFLVDRIESALAAQGISGIPIRPPHMSPAHSRRRAALRAERRGKQILLGFNAAKSNRLIDLGQCPVLHPALEALLKPLRGLLLTLIPDRRGAQLRLTLTDQGVDLLIAGVTAEGLVAAEALTDFAATHKLARLSLDEGFGPAARWEPEPVTITLGNIPVALPEGAFLQATADGEAALVHAVREAIQGATKVADLFAGLGTFALALDGQILAAEGARDALLALQIAANRAGRPIQIAHRDLFRRPFLGSELAGFEAVVLDPPRAGAKEQVAELAISGVPRLAYVSCNPATFARDAATLMSGGYRLDWVQPVGQFRWSTHVELAAAFTR
ncbi:MAG: class I SAM-dependent RNA methyltransferase [Chakrabartia sp.]